MKNIRIITVGKISSWTYEALRHFEKLLKRFAKLDFINLKTGGDLNRDNWDVIKEREGKKILEKVRGVTVVLDVKGKRMDSMEFSVFLQNLPKEITFIIGGPLGLSDFVKNSSDHIISLSDLTFSHEIALVVLMEQLFRGFKISCGEKYSY